VAVAGVERCEEDAEAKTECHHDADDRVTLRIRTPKRPDEEGRQEGSCQQPEHRRESDEDEAGRAVKPTSAKAWTCKRHVAATTKRLTSPATTATRIPRPGRSGRSRSRACRRADGSLVRPHRLRKVVWLVDVEARAAGFAHDHDTASNSQHLDRRLVQPRHRLARQHLVRSPGRPTPLTTKTTRSA